MINPAPLFEGLVDISVELTIREIAEAGITNQAQLVILCKALQAIVSYSQDPSKTFNEWFNESVIDDAIIHRIRGMSTVAVKLLASTVKVALAKKNSEKVVVSQSLADLLSVSQLASHTEASE